jgi:uncharacterized repeat protein (TIGR03847 family)
MWDFGSADLLEPEAIGEPGQRRFRLRVMSGPEAASLWMEKEQLAALTLAIRQLLEQTPPPSAQELEAPEPPGADFPLNPEVDFQIGRLGIGYDEANRMVVLFAYTVEDEEDAPPAFACRATRRQCSTFAERAEETISAGRPVCVLCGVPIEQGTHKCLRRNGHSDMPVSLS